MAVSTRSSRVVLICSSEKCACKRERKCHPRELQIPNAYCDPVRSSPVSVSLFLSLATPTPQADRGVCGHTISRWPCTGLLMIGESVAGLSRRLRVSFGVESRPPPGPPNCVFLSEKHTIHNLSSPSYYSQTYPVLCPVPGTNPTPWATRPADRCR